MKTTVRTSFCLLAIIVLVAACKKEDQKAVPTEPSAPTIDSTISIKISLFNSTKKAWGKPDAYVTAPGFESEKVALSVSTLTSTFPPPCDDYYFNAAKDYNLKLKKGVLDTIIMRNISSSGDVIFLAKFTYDLSKTSVELKSVVTGTVSTGIVCNTSPNRVSFGYH